MFARLALASLLPLAACGGAAAPSTGALPDRCRVLAQALTDCGAVVPSDARAPLQEVMKAQRARWDEAAKKGGDALRDLEVGCRDALEQAKATTRTLCPDVSWEAPAAPLAAISAPSTTAPDAGATTVPASVTPPAAPDADAQPSAR